MDVTPHKSVGVGPTERCRPVDKEVKNWVGENVMILDEYVPVRSKLCNIYTLQGWSNFQLCEAPFRDKTMRWVKVNNTSRVGLKPLH